ncbi:MAG: hypothetical protein K0M45_04475 [Candidatus Paracaedibacteraceae bacterium]|nr:hypothetical protein [Candidatus Paracaedibacteraceae bacterium]
MSEPTLTKNDITVDQLKPYYIDHPDKIGRSTRYYDYVFQQILDGERPKINWAAGFMSNMWAVYRRQYELAFVISLIFMIVGTVETCFPQYVKGLSLFLCIALFFVLAFKGNTYYFNAIKKKIEIGIIPTHPSNNTDKHAVSLIIVYFIVTLMLFLNVMLGTLSNPEIASMAEKTQQIEELARQALKFNWTGFILFWGVLYMWRIRPESNNK